MTLAFEVDEYPPALEEMVGSFVSFGSNLAVFETTAGVQVGLRYSGSWTALPDLVSLGEVRARHFGGIIDEGPPNDEIAIISLEAGSLLLQFGGLRNGTDLGSGWVVTAIEGHALCPNLESASCGGLVRRIPFEFGSDGGTTVLFQGQTETHNGKHLSAYAAELFEQASVDDCNPRALSYSVGGPR